MLKGGVFGFGGVGQNMTRRIQEKYCDNFKIVAMVDLDPQKLDLAKNVFNIKAFDNLEKMLDENLDFVLITSTNHVHAFAAKLCATAKIPFLIEKPIAINYSDAKEIADVVAKNNVKTVINYSMRYSPLFKKIKSMVDAGVIGDLMSVCISSYRGFGFYGSGKRHPAITNPQQSGGWTIHHMTHIIDYAIWLAGEVQEVYAHNLTTAPKELKSEELICSLLKFKSGAVGTASDQIGTLRDHQLQVVGTKGALAEADINNKHLIKFSLESRAYKNIELIDPSTEFREEDGLSHFLKILKTNEPSLMPVSSGLYVTKVCEAIKRSAYEKRIIYPDTL